VWLEGDTDAESETQAQSAGSSSGTGASSGLARRTSSSEQLHGNALGLLTNMDSVLSLFVHLNPVPEAGDEEEAVDLLVHMNTLPLKIVYAPELIKAVLAFVVPPDTADLSALQVGCSSVVNVPRHASKSKRAP